MPPMDKTTAVCLLSSSLGIIFQATQRSLDDEELNELARLLRLIVEGLPGGTEVNAKARELCISVYSSALFQSKNYGHSDLHPLLQQGEALRVLLNPICDSQRVVPSVAS